MKRKISPQEAMNRLAENIRERRRHWREIREKGCSDPFWSDGCNLNLTRNHIISYRRQMEELKEETGQELPGEYYIPIPPEIENDFMADPESERMKSVFPTDWQERTKRYMEQRAEVREECRQLSIFEFL